MVYNFFVKIYIIVHCKELLPIILQTISISRIEKPILIIEIYFHFQRKRKKKLKMKFKEKDEKRERDLYFQP